MDSIFSIKVMTAPHPAASKRFCNRKLTWWHPLQLLINTVFMRRSSGVFSGKLAAHSVPESCLWKSARFASVKSTCFFAPPERVASALEVSKPTACAQILYCPPINEGNEYRPDPSVYTVVVKVSLTPRAEIPTPSRGLPSADFTVPERVLPEGADWEKPFCAEAKNCSNAAAEKIRKRALLVSTMRLHPSEENLQHFHVFN